MITRRHFMGYKAGCAGAPPPLHVVSCQEHANWFPSPRPLGGATGVRPGPGLIIGGTGMPSLGIDPTDSSTWSKRGYSHSPGMAPRFDNIPGKFGDLATGGYST